MHFRLVTVITLGLLAAPSETLLAQAGAEQAAFEPFVGNLGDSSFAPYREAPGHQAATTPASISANLIAGTGELSAGLAGAPANPAATATRPQVYPVTVAFENAPPGPAIGAVLPATHDGVQLARALPPVIPDLPPPVAPPLELEEPVEVVIDSTTPVPAVKIWSGNVELGINGTAGNSETFNMRAGGQLQRKTETSLFKGMTTYLKNSANGTETANRSFTEGRYEWLNPNSRWTPYVHGLLEYDEFRNFDLRITADAGLGYQFIDTETTDLQARAGFGASKEFGSPDDDVKPEAVFGAEFSRKISARQSIDLSVDYYPSVEDLNDFRLNTVLNWVFVIDEANNLSLKLGIIDRYDSTPSGAKYNDIDYSLLLLWAF